MLVIFFDIPLTYLSFASRRRCFSRLLLLWFVVFCFLLFLFVILVILLALPAGSRLRFGGRFIFRNRCLAFGCCWTVWVLELYSRFPVFFAEERLEVLTASSIDGSSAL
jgi:hypothetical protein